MCLFYFQIYYSKNPKIPCCTFSLFILFCVIARSIYPKSYKPIYLLPEEGLTTPLTLRVASMCSLCACTIYIAWTGLLLDWYLGFITKGNTYRSCAASSLPLLGNTDVVQAILTWTDIVFSRTTVVLFLCRNKSSRNWTKLFGELFWNI